MKRLLFAIMLLGMTTVFAQEELAYLKMGGMNGDSQMSGRQSWIELSTFDQGPYRWTKKGGTRNYLPRESGAEGTGKLTVTRVARNHSQQLYEAAAKGTYFGTVEIDIPLRTGMGDRYVRWTLSDVIVTGLNIERAHGKKGLPIEQITLSYQKAEWQLPDQGVQRREPKSSNSWHQRS